MAILETARISLIAEASSADDLATDGRTYATRRARRSVSLSVLVHREYGEGDGVRLAILGQAGTSPRAVSGLRAKAIAAEGFGVLLRSRAEIIVD
jgi:hypothetical protein